MVRKLGLIATVVFAALVGVAPANGQFAHRHALSQRDSSDTGGDKALNRQRLNANLLKGLNALRRSDGRGINQALDYALLVDPFIGTEGNSNPGNVFPGASQPFGMAKIGIDLDGVYAPAGYVTNVSAAVRGVGLLHDSGTGSGDGSYGNFESLPILCPDNNIHLCPTRLDDRKRARKPGQDYAEPGYFTLTLNNGIKLEATTTRRAGLLRYTYPQSVTENGRLHPFVVQDWTNDLPGTFRGGEIYFDSERGRVQMNGSWASSFGPTIFTYKAFGCIDTLNGGKQKLGKTALWQGDRFGQDTKLENERHANLTRIIIGGQPVQAGALFSFADFPKTADGSAEITLRVGLSFNSVDQACRNAEEEIGEDWNFARIVKQSRDLWNEKLNRFSLDPGTDSTIARLFYTSLYYSFLTPSNATLEAGNLFVGAEKHEKPYYDGLYCTWDSYRTFFPFLSLSSPVEYAQITENYIDGWRQQGWIPECRANNVPGLTQGGSHGVMVIADFVVKYFRQAFTGFLPTQITDGRAAIKKDSYVTPAAWDAYGRQITVYGRYGYIPTGVFDTVSSGRQTREVSRTVEYAHNDFAAGTVATILSHLEEANYLYNRSLSYRNLFDKSVTSFGTTGFLQKRFTNGTFASRDPTECSPISNAESCSLQQNEYGIYETSAWEYTFYAPHDVAGLIKLVSDGDRAKFIKRLDTYFAKGLFYAGNEPSFNTPVLYHYANAPVKSVRRVREVVFQNFNTTTAGLPGNSDVGAMQTLLNFHLLGLFPVPATTEFLVVSPFVPSFEIKNPLMGNVHFEAKNFDPRSVAENIPEGARAYVKAVYINGKKQSSRCKILFTDLFPPGATGTTGAKTETTITLEMTGDADAVNRCGATDADLPSSLSTGGFRSF